MTTLCFRVEMKTPSSSPEEAVCLACCHNEELAKKIETLVREKFNADFQGGIHVYTINFSGMLGHDIKKRVIREKDIIYPLTEELGSIELCLIISEISRIREVRALFPKKDQRPAAIVDQMQCWMLIEKKSNRIQEVLGIYANAESMNEAISILETAKYTKWNIEQKSFPAIQFCSGARSIVLGPTRIVPVANRIGLEEYDRLLTYAFKNSQAHPSPHPDASSTDRFLNV
jgi:hypothetical protein